MTKTEEYLSKIDKIPTVSFNKEQKIIAKKIIKKTNEKDLDAVYGLITQRVKTGFIFDEAPEVNHNAVAIVKENEALRIDGDGLDCIEHKLIIGENYDALKNLCATYIDKNGKGQIDVIYIDPPYNTEATKQEGNDYKEEVEATKFIYRDKFTRDGWLNMMNERLKLARSLLSDSGVIFISIDDSEQAYLKVLCDEIFGEENSISCAIWNSINSVLKNSKFIRKDHEYILIYSKNKNNLENFNKLENSMQFSNPDNDPNGEWFSSNAAASDQSSDLNKFKIELPNGNFCERNWKFTYDDFINKKVSLYLKNGNVPRLKIYKKDCDLYTKIQSSIFTNLGSITTATKEIEKIFNIKVFETPKPVSLIKHILKIASQKDSVILDFFAGSGTTGQAVMELNEEDGGNRQFILVTNNENNIGEKITRERLYRVIKGVGSKGEKFEWTYSKDTPFLNKNSVRVFDIETHKLTLNDLDKAEELKEKAKLEFKKLNQDYSTNNDFDIYNELSSLNPQK